MPDFSELKQQAEKLAKQRQWKQAFDTYKIMFTNYPDHVEFSAWDNYWYARCAFETGRIDFALKLSHRLKKLYPQFTYNNNLLTQIKLSILQRKAKIMQSEEIVAEYQQIIQTIDDDYWASKIVINVARILMSKEQHKLALEILVDFDKKRLSDKLLKTPEGKTIPSQQESFYLLMAKLLVINKLYEKAVEIIDWVLENIKLTGNNRKWFILYKADALANMAEYEKAIEQYMQINKRPVWFIDFRVARVLYNMEKYKPALSFLCRSALSHDQSTWFKIGVFKYFLKNFADRFSKEQLNNLVLMIIALYKENGHANSDFVQQLSQRFGIKIDAPIDLKSVEKQTYHTIKKIYYGRTFNGRIIRILRNSGFIQGGQKNIYFRFDDVRFDKKLLRQGLAVKYNVVWDYDYGKKRLAEKAVNIRLLNEK